MRVHELIERLAAMHPLDEVMVVTDADGVEAPIPFNGVGQASVTRDNIERRPALTGREGERYVVLFLDQEEDEDWDE